MNDNDAHGFSLDSNIPDDLLDQLIESGKQVGPGATNSVPYKLLLKLKEQRQDYKTWVQVGVLNEAEKAKRRSHERMAGLYSRELTMLDKKIDAIKANVEAESAEWWNALHKEHSLPINGSYHVADDGRILADPKSLRGPKADEAKP